jgi:hypothetical protein
MLGGYGTQVYAERDAQEFMRPDVFQYKTAFFANPINFGIEAKVTDAKAIKVEKPDSPLYPWGIKMTVSAKGDKAANWMTDFENRIRIHRVNQ